VELAVTEGLGFIIVEEATVEMGETPEAEDLDLKILEIPKNQTELLMEVVEVQELQMKEVKVTTGITANPAILTAKMVPKEEAHKVVLVVMATAEVTVLKDSLTAAMEDMAERVETVKEVRVVMVVMACT